jgi:DNA-binding NtrC family response regulator
MDVSNEEACLCLMRLYALNQDRASALQAYRDCAASLKRDFEVEPGEALRSAYEQLLHGGPQAAPQSTQPASLSLSNPLIGRQAEWKRLLELWRRAAQGHASLVLITGEAGIGKTRLAEELFQLTALPTG